MPGGSSSVGRLFARQALTANGWQRDVLVTWSDGVITAIKAGAQAAADTPAFDLLLSGMANVHSHAFQRAMAGLTESAAQMGRDNFWTWREVMYAFAGALTPEQVEVIATALYIELLKHGYTAVGEFHYLHHDPGGQSYATPTELSDRMIAAAQTAGIHITLLPVLYEASDFGGAPANPRQRRFIHSPARYLRLMETLVARHGKAPGVNLGVAPHSLRAATPQSIETVLQALCSLGLTGCPIHIHAAEQEKEVADCMAWSGQRPVEWLLSHLPVDAHWCVIHATHITPDEMDGLIRSGATAGLCPCTEANLGDGIFPAEAYLKANGRFAIGSDSNIAVSPFEELRALEYAQRLTLRKRAVLHSEATPSVGRTLFASASANGARALGLGFGALAVGGRADLVALTTDNAMLAGKEQDRLLDALVFAVAKPPITDVFVAGQRVIAGGINAMEEGSERALHQVMKQLESAV